MTSASAGLAGVPFIDLGMLHSGAFGVIVVIAVLVGIAMLRGHGRRCGVHDDDLHALAFWVTVSGFVGAHVFDVLAYQTGELASRPLVLLELWNGLSSFGGFLGGAIGFTVFVRSRRLPIRVMADITMVGLLPAFTIGRIACTVVSDHVGATVDPTSWYAVLAMEYPRELNLGHLAERYPGPGATILAWNLGFLELVCLLPINALVLTLALRHGKAMRAGLLAALATFLYAPARLALDFLRPEEVDPRYLLLTFAQWGSLLVGIFSLSLLIEILIDGKPHAVAIRSRAQT